MAAVSRDKHSYADTGGRPSFNSEDMGDIYLARRERCRYYPLEDHT